MLHLPRIHYEWALFLLFWFGGLWLLYFELYFVSPHYHSSWNNTMTLHLIIAVFCASNIYMNMVMMITTDISCKQITSPPGVGWTFCDKCQIDVPPRSHHCKICKVCILRRDHHCFFSGYCVGYFNHRYFFAMAVYMTFAAFYCNIYNWKYFIDMKGGFSWTTIPGIIAPHMGLMFGFYTIPEFLLNAHTFTGIMLNILFVVLLGSQLCYCFTGQLWYERKKGICNYRIGLRKTLVELFGSAGLWVFVCPLIPSKMPGDGTTSPIVEGVGGRGGGDCDCEDMKTK